MKMIVKFIVAASFFGFVACNNAEKTTEETKVQETESSNPGTATEPKKKTEVSIGPDGAEVKTKKGTEVKVGESGGSVGNKDVNIRINTKDTTKKKN